MNLINYFRQECIQICTESSEKEDVLREIAKLAKRCDVLQSYSEEDIYTALKNREEIGTTAFEGGIALPHCALDNVDTFVVGVVTSDDGVDFESMDGEPTRLLTFIIGPADQRNEHVTLLSEISRVLNDKAAVEELVRSRNPEALSESFLRRHRHSLPHQDKEKCLFHVIVQQEHLFNDILEIFSSAVVEGDLSVVEANNAGSYLNRIPMFAAFWKEQDSGFCRVILAVVDKDLSNEVVRRINVCVDDLEQQQGVLVTVHELMLVRGSLNF